MSSDISTMFFDVTNLAAKHPQLIDDSIPLEAGSRLFESAQKLVVAAAGATIRRQGHFGHQMPNQARGLARHVRMGQTRRGSYILPVISRARPLLNISTEKEPHLDLHVEESLFDRRVMATFAGALDALEEMVVHASRAAPRSQVLDAVGVGVSREMCQALMSVVKSESVADLDIVFNWASGVPVPGGVTSEMSFPKESLPVIESVSNELRRIPREREDGVLYGLITDLHWGPDVDEYKGVQRVGIETVIDRRRRTVWFSLNEASYEQALRYHESRQRVVVRGILRAVSGQPLQMEVNYFGPDLALVPGTDHPSNAS